MASLADDLFGDGVAAPPTRSDAGETLDSRDAASASVDVPVPKDFDAEEQQQQQTASPSASATAAAEERDPVLEDSDGDDLFGDKESAAGSDDGFIVNDDGEAERDPELEEAAAVEVKVSEVEVPDYGYPVGDGDDDDELYLCKLPNSLNIAVDAYTADGLLADIAQERDADAGANATERTQRKTDRVENTLRWRWEDAAKSTSTSTSTPSGTETEEGGLKRVSNARFVRWSDGSMSFQIGSEFFDVPVQALDREHNYLALMHAQEEVLRSVRRFTKGLSFLPYSLNSKAVRDLRTDMTRRAAAERGRTVKEIATLEDPEERQKKAAKAEADRLKSKRRLDVTRARHMGGGSGGGGGSSGGAARYAARRSRLTADMLDASDDELGAGARRGRYDDEDDDMGDFIEDDEEESDEEEAGAQRLRALKESGARSYAERKRKALEDDDEDDDEDDSDEDAEEEEEEEEKAIPAAVEEKEAPRKKAKRRIADDSDEDDD